MPPQIIVLFVTYDLIAPFSDLLLYNCQRAELSLIIKDVSFGFAPFTSSCCFHFPLGYSVYFVPKELCYSVNAMDLVTHTAHPPLLGGSVITLREKLQGKEMNFQLLNCRHLGMGWGIPPTVFRSLHAKKATEAESNCFLLCPCTECNTYPRTPCTLKPHSTCKGCSDLHLKCKCLECKLCLFDLGVGTILFRSSHAHSKFPEL